jgi:hypothetical protein
MPRETLQSHEIDGLRRGFCRLNTEAGELIGAQTLEIAVAFRASEHVQDLDVAGSAVEVTELILQGTG